jgi:hypothetical protein
VTFDFSYTWQEILFAAGIALVITWVIRVFSTLFRAVITRSTEFEFSLKNKSDVTERCYEMFPTDHIMFNGETLRRGMQVCMVTLRQKKYEGLFIGINRENMVCLMTERSVVAQELDTIEDIWEM